MPKPKKVRQSFNVELENLEMVRTLAKSLGTTQSEIINCLIALTKKEGIKNELIIKIANKLEKRLKRLRRMTTRELEEVG